MTALKTIGVVFVDGWADWEFGLLTGSVPEWFGGRIVSISPEGKPVRSIGGLMLTPERSADPDRNGDLDAVAIIGSDTWASAQAPDVAPLIRTVADRGGIVGGICAGTLALARAGLFARAKHTSNEPQWLDHVLASYPGRENYSYVPYAVRDGNVISAPGSAPGTFAIEMLKALYPEKADLFPQMRQMFSAEFATT